jgi:1-acyl-sn-glycerol-3-phosphate acyltransferase
MCKSVCALHSPAIMALPGQGLLQRTLELATMSSLSADPLDRRDPQYIIEQGEALGRMCDFWYQPELMGLDNLPPGRALVVGTHNGGFMAPDMFSLMVGFWRHFGVERQAYGLAHDFVFKTPFAGRHIAKLGGVPASQENARKLLERDLAVLVYPGGDRDSYKPYRERHKVKFAGRRGFIRLALATGAPIVPVISVGAHEIIYVLTDGATLAERLGLKKRFRLDVLPIALTLPFGVTIGAMVPYVPMPTRIRVKVLPPIQLGLPPSAAEDDAVVQGAMDRVTAVMQEALDALVAEGGFGPAARIRATTGP